MRLLSFRPVAHLQPSLVDELGADYARHVGVGEGANRLPAQTQGAGGRIQPGPFAPADPGTRGNAARAGHDHRMLFLKGPDSCPANDTGLPPERPAVTCTPARMVIVSWHVQAVVNRENGWQGGGSRK